MNRRQIKHLTYLLLSLSLTGGLGWYFFSHHTLGDVIDAIRGVPRRYIFSFLVFSMLMSVFRAWRYRMLLLADGYDCPPLSLFLITIVRNLFSDLLPARLGSLIYIYLVNTRLGVPFSAATSSFAYAFLFDLIAVCPIAVICLLSFVVPEQINSAALLLGVVVLFTVIVTAIVMLPSIISVVIRVVHKFNFKEIKKIEKLLTEFRESLEKIKEARIYGRILTLSVISRAFKYAGLYVFLLGLGISLGLDQEIFPLQKSIIGLLSAELAASLPVSGISGFGAYESAWAFTFSLLGIEQRLAEMTAFSHHLFTQAYGYLIGIVALLILLLPLFTVKTAPMIVQFQRSHIFKFTTRVTTVLVMGLLLAFASLFTASEAKSGEDLSFFKEWKAGEVLPDVIFDSNRSGRFGIYATDLEGKVITKIVDTRAHEMFPVLSPDGKQLVFSRHLTLSRQSPADIVTLSLETGLQTITENGAFPTFSADGNKLFFERNRSKIMALDLESRELVEIFPVDQFPDFSGYEIVKPRVSTDQRFVVFTSDKGGRWHAWLADLEKSTTRMIGQGCEPVFSPDGKSIVWVSEEDSKQGSGFKILNLETNEEKVFLDQGEPWGREYFPTFSKDGNELFFSAAPPGDYSHETANYQIFYLEVESGIIHRLTEDTYTNRWPKLINDNIFAEGKLHE